MLGSGVVSAMRRLRPTRGGAAFARQLRCPAFDHTFRTPRVLRLQRD